MSGEYELTGPGHFTFSLPGLVSSCLIPSLICPQAGSRVCFFHSVEPRNGRPGDPHQLQGVRPGADEIPEALGRTVRGRQTLL